MHRFLSPVRHVRDPCSTLEYSVYSPDGVMAAHVPYCLLTAIMRISEMDW